MKEKSRNIQRDKIRKLIDAWPESGVSKKDYCKQAGIPSHSFYYWQKKFNLESTDAGFVPVEVNALADQPVEIIYPNGMIIRFHSTPDMRQIQSLIKLGL